VKAARTSTNEVIAAIATIAATARTVRAVKWSR
jgi:hypothetical protein